MRRMSVFLIMVALIAGMVGCGGGGGGGVIRYDLTINSMAGGSVTTPGEGTFTSDEGTVVNLVAEAEEGHRFVNWIGDVDTITNVEAATTSITMNDHCSITANFVPGELIRTWDDLDNVRNNLSGTYILMNDLSSTTAGYEQLASPIANEGKGWQPIGTGDGTFNGTFDGQGHEISDLFIYRPNIENPFWGEGEGLFGIVGKGGVISNLGMVNVTVIGDDFVGGMAGINEGIVSNSYSTGSVTGSREVGGLVGMSGYDGCGIVSDCYSTCNVTGEENIVTGGVGGLVGSNYNILEDSHSTGSVTGQEIVGGLVGFNIGNVTSSYSTGSVSGHGSVGGLVGQNNGVVINSYSTTSASSDQTCVGGLVGYNGGGIVSKSYSTGSVTGGNFVGGLIGDNDANVSNSYSTGNVTGEQFIGGFVGRNREGGTVSYSYSTGDVIGSDWVGGLLGWNEGGAVTNSFWDIETSGQGSSAGGTGKTTAEIQDITTFSGATWSIVAVANPSTRNPAYIWNIVDDETYPFLSWES